MGLYTGTVKNLRRAPYRTQVLAHLLNLGWSEEVSEKEEQKIERVKRFLSAYECAREIDAARSPIDGSHPYSLVGAEQV
jgi:hypothetical protein